MVLRHISDTVESAFPAHSSFEDRFIQRAFDPVIKLFSIHCLGFYFIKHENEPAVHSGTGCALYGNCVFPEFDRSGKIFRNDRISVFVFCFHEQSVKIIGNLFIYIERILPVDLFAADQRFH